MLTRLAVLFALGFLLTPSAAAADDILVAAWETEKHKAKLIYQGDKMLWERQYDEVAYREDLIERPAPGPGERKFDRDETVRAKYFTLSDIGIVRYFSWDGKHLGTALTTFMDSEAMTIGSDAQVRKCGPKQVSAAANQLIRLYKQLRAFKDDPEFAEVGFSSGGPYSVWQAESRTFGEETQAELFRELGFWVGDLILLAHHYRNLAGDILRGRHLDPTEIENMEDNERTIGAHISVALCE